MIWPDDYVNKIIVGDCLEVMKGIPDGAVDCVITDPPYNINKADWDNIKNYEEWLVGIFAECQRVLKDNGTLWFFHMVFETLAKLHTLMVEKTEFRHKQFITINKGLASIAGRTSENLRSFPRATEYLQFYTFSDITGAEQLSDTYASANPFAKYLISEFDRSGIKRKEIAGLFPSKNGILTGCVSNWLLGYNVPTKDQYLKMREYLNCEYLRKEYEDLRKEYEDLRYTFNSYVGITDVWDINFALKHKTGHPAQKPTEPIKRILRSASIEEFVIFDPFCGSGTTCVAAKEMGRKFIGIEISPEYAAIAQRRVDSVGHQLEVF